MNSTAEPRLADDSATARWRVRDLVSPEILADIDWGISELAAQVDSRHAELAFRIDSVALMKLAVSNESTLPCHVAPRWIIVPPARDAAMQTRIWNFWLEAINSMQGEPRPSTRTMSVECGIYLAAGVMPIQSVEFCAFDCTLDERVSMQSGETEAPLALPREVLFLTTALSDSEPLTLPLELVRQLRLGQRVAQLWRDEFHHWRAFPPYDFWPPKQIATPTVPLDLDAWCEAIGAGIERIIGQDLLSGSTVRPMEGAARPKDIREPSGKDRETNSMREAHILKRRLLPMFFAPSTALRRAIRRALRQWRNCRR